MICEINLHCECRLSPVELAHVVAGVEGEVEDAEPPLAGHGGVEQRGLDVDAVLLGQLVVVLDLAGEGHVAVERRQLHVRSVRHVERPEEVRGSDPRAGAHPHDGVKHNVSKS